MSISLSSTLGLNLSTNMAGIISASFSVTLTGLDGGIANVGSHASIGYTINPDNGTETVKWSNSSSPADAATYGTGASPTDFTAGNGGTLYLHVTDGGDTVTRSASILYAAAPTFSVQPTISGTPAIGETLTFNEGTAAPGATLSITTLTLAGVDKAGELVGSDWDTTGESVGQISYQVTATNNRGSTLSNVITADLAEALSIEVEPDNTLTINNLGSGDFSVTVSGSSNSNHNATFTQNSDGTNLNTTLLDAGPVNLVKAVISGSTGLGDTLTSVPGLWIYDGDIATPTITGNWQAGGVNVDPAGTALTYDITSDEQGTSVTYLEQAADANGTRTAASNAIAVPAAASHLTFTQHTGISDSAIAAGAFSMPGITANNASANRTFELTISLYRGAVVSPTNIAINGVTATPVISTSNFNIQRIYKYKATVPTGTSMVVSGDLSGTGASEIHVQLYSAASDFTVVDTAANANAFNELTIPLNMDNALGDLRMVGAFFLNATDNTFVGVTQDALITNGSFRTYIGLLENAPAGTDATISATGTGESRRVAVGAVYRAVP